jgi:hypothetical protein
MAWLHKKVSNMLTETFWLNMLLHRGEVKLTKYDLETAHLDTLVSFLLTGISFLHCTRDPSGPGPLHYRRFMITLRHTNSEGLLWTGDHSDAETSTWQHTTLTRDTHAACKIRTYNPHKRADVDPRLTQRDHWDRHHLWVCGHEQQPWAKSNLNLQPSTDHGRKQTFAYF